VRGLPPGEYYVGIVDGVEQGEQYDVEFLQRLAPVSQRVTVKAGGSVTVDIKVR
jgi:hypothetical protein